MAVTLSRTGALGAQPRLAMALGASLALHAMALLPIADWLPKTPRVVLPPLAVHLPPEQVQEVATHEEILSPPAEMPAPVPKPSDKPRELKGRALDTALAALSREEFYPREAIARGLEGRVVLLLTLDAAGRVHGLEVASSSGHALLDDAALRAATRITQLPGDRRQVLLPVDFRLE